MLGTGKPIAHSLLHKFHPYAMSSWPVVLCQYQPKRFSISGALRLDRLDAKVWNCSQ